MLRSTPPILFSAALSLMLTASSVNAASPPSATTVTVPTESKQRPRVGLVLGGGGARGAAHIGVLEVLEKHNIKIDCVAGTSMGGLVAGGFAGGLNSKAMLDGLSKANWRDMFIDYPDYDEQSYRSKKLSSRFIPGLEMGVTNKGVELPAGVVAGQKLRLFFNHLVHADVTQRNIEDLPLKLSIIATNIGNGDRVVFREDSLTTAMRASMSVPGLLSPVDYKGNKLVDGGLVDNVPIAEVRERCNPDVVIAVNVGSPLLKPEDIGSLVSVSAQMVNILTEQNVSRSLSTPKPTDIYIKPDLEGITAGDFERYAETAERGRKAAEAIVERLKPLSAAPEDYAAWWEKIEVAKRETPTIEDIKIAGLKYVNPAAVSKYLRTKPGEPVNTAELNEDMMRIYGENYYERVEYTMLPVRDKRLLTVTPVEKPWGPDYLRFGFNLESDKIIGSSYMLRAAYQKTWVNNLGAEFLVAAELGNNPAFAAEFYQPLDAQQRFFAEIAAGIRRDQVGIYQNNHRLAEYDIERRFASFQGGINVGILGQVRAGWLEQSGSADLRTGTAPFTSPSGKNSGWVSSLDFDQLDRLYFPTRGWKTRLRYFNSVDNNYGRVDAGITVAYSLSDYVINGQLTRTAGSNGPLPTRDPASLGGLFYLSGFGKNQILGGSSTFGSIRGEKIIGRMPLGLRGDMRVGLSLEGGKMDDLYTETNKTGWLNSTAIYLGGETPLGPVYLGYGYSTKGSSNIILQIGTP